MKRFEGYSVNLYNRCFDGYRHLDLSQTNNFSSKKSNHGGDQSKHLTMELQELEESTLCEQESFKKDYRFPLEGAAYFRSYFLGSIRPL